MPSYRFRVRLDNMDEDDLGDLYSYIDWESRSGDWDINGPQSKDEQWFGVQFERKGEAVYFKTRFKEVEVIEWDESGTEPRTKEELLEQGHCHMQTSVQGNNRQLFESWCEQHNVGVVSEIKLIRDEIEPYNIYVPPALIADAEMLWNARRCEGVPVEEWKRFTMPIGD